MKNDSDLIQSLVDWIVGLITNPSILLTLAITITLAISFTVYVNISNRKNKVVQKSRGNNSPNINISNGDNLNDN